MADTHGSADSDFDLTQFYQVFFEEAAENLDQMEQMLLNLDLTQANDEELNGIFRCAHSIKGGSATFGFTDVAELTHKMESLLDRLRRHEITPIPEMVDALLESADASRSLLARHQAGGAGEAVPTGDLVRRIVDLAAGNRPNAAPATATAAVAAPAPQAPAPIKVATAAPALTNGERLLQLKIGPVENLEAVDAIKELFRDIPGLGSIEDLACDQPQHRLFQVKTQATNDDLLDLMVFHVSKEQVHITDQAGAVPSATAPMAMGLADPDAALMEADVDHIHTHLGQALHQRSRQRGTRQTTITTHRHGFFTGNQRCQPIGGDLVGALLILAIALASVKFHGGKQLAGHRLETINILGIGHHVHADIAFTPQHQRVVVDGVIGVTAAHFPGRRRPEQMVIIGTISRYLGPTDHFQLGDASGLTLFIGGLGTLFEVIEQFVGIPILGVIILDVTGGLITDHHHPVLLIALGQDHPLYGRIAFTVKGLEESLCLGFWDIGEAFRQLQCGLLTNMNG